MRVRLSIGVEQRLALGRRRTRDVEVDDVGGQALGGDLEGRARARRILEEQVEDALAAQERHFLHVAVGDFEETRCGVEDLRRMSAADRRSTGCARSPLALSCGLCVAVAPPLQSAVVRRHQNQFLGVAHQTCQAQNSAQIGSLAATAVSQHGEL